MAEQESGADISLLIIALYCFKLVPKLVVWPGPGGEERVNYMKWLLESISNGFVRDYGCRHLLINNMIFSAVSAVM